MTDPQTTVGVIAESGSDERRVALVPKAVAALVNSGLAVVGFLAPRHADNQIEALTNTGVQAFALEAIPRIAGTG